MISDNVPTSRHHGAPKHGDALLAGLLRCRRCGRKSVACYTGTKHNIPRYACHRGRLDIGEPSCIAFGGLRVDDAIAAALLQVVEPGAIMAAVAAEAEAADRQDQVRATLLRDLEAARYAADRAFRQYDAADPANRLVAGELEARWNTALGRVTDVEAKIATHDAVTPVRPQKTSSSFAALAGDLEAIWSAPMADTRLKKRIVRTVIQEVVADIVVERSARVPGGQLLLQFGFVAELRMLAFEQLVPPQQIDAAALGGRHQPGAGPVGDAVARPMFERRDQRLLRQLLGEADIAQHAREACDQLGLLDAEHRFDGAMCVGSKHTLPTTANRRASASRLSA